MTELVESNNKEKHEDVFNLSDEKVIAMLAHFSIILNILIPFGGAGTAFVMWKLYEKNDFIRENARESFNWQLSATICIICLNILIMSMAAMGMYAFFGGTLFSFSTAAFVLAAVLSILNGIEAKAGKIPTYKYKFEFIKKRSVEVKHA